MRHAILLTALALGAQAAWAQEPTDPMPTEDGVVVEETTAFAEEPASTDGADPAEAVDLPAEEAAGEAVGETEGVEEVAEEAEGAGTEVVDDGAGETDGGEVVAAPPADSRSPRGAFRGGHRGSVSTLARAGLGSVFGALRSQGYGGVEIEQVGDEIFISAERAGEARHLVYDATTGALVSDVTEPSSPGLAEAVTTRLKKDRPWRGKLTRDAASSRSDGSTSKGKGNGSNKGGRSGKGNGGSKAGGNGKGNSADKRK